MSFLNRPPTTTISGLTLSRDTAHSLIALCSSLSKLLRCQTVDVSNLPATPLTLVSFVEKIQSRQQDIKQKLNVLISHVKLSSVPWLCEFEDMRSAIDGKVKMYNKKARKKGWGWQRAARAFWPMVGESCEVLLGLLERLNDELQDGLDNEELWRKRKSWLLSIETSPSSRPKESRTSFDKVVRAQACKEEGVYRDFITKLISERKHTAGTLKRRETDLTKLYKYPRVSGQRREESVWVAEQRMAREIYRPAQRHFLFS